MAALNDTISSSLEGLQDTGSGAQAEGQPDHQRQTVGNFLAMTAPDTEICIMNDTDRENPVMDWMNSAAEIQRTELDRMAKPSGNAGSVLTWTVSRVKLEEINGVKCLTVYAHK